MKLTIVAIAAVALCPALALAQGGGATNPSSQSGAAADTGQRAMSTARGEVSPASGPGGASGAAEMTQAMRQAQEDPNLVGSPAWWRTHVTADGKTGTPR